MYERLILLKELLSKDGSIFVRIDYHFGHYIKVILDEIFGKENFRNEVILKRTRTLKGEFGRFHTATESLFLYSKGETNILNGYRTLKSKNEQEWVEMHLPGSRKDENLLYRNFFSKVIKAPEGRR